MLSRAVLQSTLPSTLLFLGTSSLQSRHDLVPKVARLVRVVVILQHASQVACRQRPISGKHLGLELPGTPAGVPREKLKTKKMAGKKKTRENDKNKIREKKHGACEFIFDRVQRKTLRTISKQYHFSTVRQGEAALSPRDIMYVPYTYDAWYGRGRGSTFGPQLF